MSLRSSHSRIFNNTSIGCPSPITFYKEKADNQILNNIVMVAGESSFNRPGGGGAPDADYNVYFSTSGTPRWEHTGQVYATFGEYQQVSGETYSRFIDPVLAGSTP